MDAENTDEYKDVMRTVENMMKRRGSLRRDYIKMHEAYVVKLIERMLLAEAGIVRGLETTFEKRRLHLEDKYKAKRMEITKQKVELYQRIELLELEIQMLREKHRKELLENIKLEKAAQ